MIGKLLRDGNEKLREIGLGSYLDKGAETGNAMRQNREYVDSLTIETRLLDSVEACTEFQFFGQTYSMPIMTAALSGLDPICKGGLIEVAKAVAAVGSVMWVGIGEAEELKSVIETGAKTAKIVKPYKDHDLVLKQLKEAEALGAVAVGMDITFFYGGKREDSVIRGDIMGPKTVAEMRDFAEATGLPFIIKGVLSEQDTRKSLEAGASAIVVSTHGGAALDFAVPPLQILPDIAAAVNGQVPIFVDSGIQRGTDVLKALALGADGVLIARPIMAALALEGSAGVEKLFCGMNEELRRAMSMTSSATLSDISAELIW